MNMFRLFCSALVDIVSNFGYIELILNDLNVHLRKIDFMSFNAAF